MALTAIEAILIFVIGVLVVIQMIALCVNYWGERRLKILERELLRSLNQYSKELIAVIENAKIDGKQ